EVIPYDYANRQQRPQPDQQLVGTTWVVGGCDRDRNRRCIAIRLVTRSRLRPPYLAASSLQGRSVRKCRKLAVRPAAVPLNTRKLNCLRKLQRFLAGQRGFMSQSQI